MKNEAEFARFVAASYREEGFDVRREELMPNGGRCDIACYQDECLVMLVEVKYDKDHARGIGQLLTYAVGLSERPKLVLAVPPRTITPTLREACGSAGIELFAFADTERMACGCVVGEEMCEAARDAWMGVGLSKLRGDLKSYAKSLDRFAIHYPLTFPRRGASERRESGLIWDGTERRREA